MYGQQGGLRNHHFIRPGFALRKVRGERAPRVDHALHLHRPRVHPVDGVRADLHVPRTAHLEPVRARMRAASRPHRACIDSRARSTCRLPPSTQKRLAAWAAQVNSVVQPYRDALQVQLWDRVGWKAKALKPPAAAKAPAAAGALATDMAALRAQLGSVVGVHSEEEWAAAMALSAELPVIVDFTATWCGPAAVGSLCSRGCNPV